jgi:putative transposase
MWHVDTTVIRLIDGTRAYLHAVIDNFSRRILAWRLADTFAPVNSVAVLLEARRGATRPASAPVVLADAGVENVNAHVDELIATGVPRRLLKAKGQVRADRLQMSDKPFEVSGG